MWVPQFRYRWNRTASQLSEPTLAPLVRLRFAFTPARNRYSSGSSFVKNAELQSDRKVFLEPHAEISFAQRRQHEVEAPHFAAIVRAAPYTVVGLGQEFGVTRISVTQRLEQRPGRDTWRANVLPSHRTVGSDRSLGCGESRRAAAGRPANGASVDVTRAGRDGGYQLSNRDARRGRPGWEVSSVALHHAFEVPGYH